MGVVFKRQSWWLDYRFNGRRHRQKVGPSKTLADNAWAKVRTEIAENKFLDIKKEKQVRFEDFADKYLDMHCKVNHRNYMRASGGQVSMLKKLFSGRFLNEITPLDIERFKGERIKDVSPATVNRGLARLKAMFNMATRWKDFDGSNPLKEVKFFKEDNHKLRYLEDHEIEKLIEVSKGNTRAIVIVAVYTGMRRSEILNLTWRDIDFNRNHIELLQTKSGKKRIINMNQRVVDALIGVRKHPKSQYVFCKRDGQPLKDIRSIFFLVLKKAGITEFRFHDLRHTFASQLAMKGVDIITIKELLGHADMKTTMIYAHLSKNHKQRAVDCLLPKVDTIRTLEQELATEPMEQELATV